MKRTATYLVVAGTVGALGVAGTMFAYANWTIPSKPITVRVRTEKMPRGVTPSAAKQSGKAVVSWSAQEIGPGSKMDHYVVTAHSVDVPPLPDITRTVAATSGDTETVTFSAAEVAGGKWYWTIVPKLHLWVGTESGKSQRLNFPGTPAAGTAAAARSVDTSTTAPTTTTGEPADGAATPPAETDRPAETTATTAPAAAVPTEAATTTPAATPTTTSPAETPSPTETVTTGP
ncbi:hypothetical protein [Paractinoplanes toevensis]|uniref:Uncharacterized protein n=1 Tax=Paractinoplanes toevensis TaxID=571911 RepID=A0A919W5F8_9ACTN|nr:hypothetical protein [Actinoplanes toevensis]GIM91233.1 hypothetical protein Ato02nite_030260 [Actinoplanes toevensis]